MHGAVTVPEMDATFFLTELPENPDKSLVIEPGAWVEVPEDLYLWPEGTDRPQQTLCRSTIDPKIYKVFKYNRDVDRSQFTPTGRNYGGKYSPEMWERFTEKLPSILAFHAIPDDDPASVVKEALHPVLEGR
jgi:hypothetical protein